jgi:SNF2 family DNA or RNA helicase
MTIFVKTGNESIHDAIKTLAAVCDGAIEEDMQGFNGADVSFGHKLALQPELTPMEEAVAIKMLQKYKGQLMEYGFDIENMKPKIEKPVKNRKGIREVLADNDLIILKGNGFSNFNAFLSDVRDIPDRRFGETKYGRCNYAPATKQAIQKIIEISEKWDFEITEDARKLIGNPIPEKKELKRLSVEDGKFIIDFPYNPEFNVEVKKINNRFKKIGNRAIRIIPITAENAAKLETLCEKFEIEITETAKTEIKNATKKAEQNLEASKAENENIEIDGLGGELRPFQKAGVAYAIQNKRTFIADEMGLGKTVQGLAAIHAQDAYPALVVCPASLKLNWKRESGKWLPGKNVSVFTPKSKPADVEIINYDILKKNLEILQGRGFKSIIFDESHYIKNGKSQRSQAAKKLAKGIDIRIALTGTPILNRPNELINQLDTIGRLDEMGGFWKFAKRYCNAHRGRWGWDLSGSSNLDELNEKLRQTCYVRREKKNVLKELPEKQRTVITIPISNKAEYKSAAKNLIAWISENESDDAAISAMSAEHLVRIEKLKQLAAEGKMKAAIEWIHSFLETGEKIVIFGTHKTVIDSIKNEFHCPTITGSDSVELRQKAVDQFQNDPDCRVIALNIKAGGVGLTLTASSNVVFLEQGWTPGEHDQAEDRCHRIGQENSVNAWYLLAENTIDQDIHDLIEEKRMVVDEATDGSVAKKLIERMKK